MENLCEKDQKYAHFILRIYFNYIILDLFRTNNCSLSGVLYKQLMRRLIVRINLIVSATRLFIKMHDKIL